MQNFIWVLCEELDPADCWDETKAKNIWTFHDFESAKTALRKLMRTRASTENKIFDGKGGIRGLTERIQEVLDGNEGTERDDDGRAILKGLHDMFIEGKPFPAECNDGIRWSDWMISCYYDLDADGDYYFSVDSETDGVTNGIDPKIYINTFQMDDPEKTYICRMDCKFDGWNEDHNGFWAVTLIRTPLNQFP